MSSASKRLAKKLEAKLAAKRAPKLESGEAFAARAQEGPQQAFVESTADFVVYGGSAGGGKSFGMLLAAARDAGVYGADAVLFRREAKHLTGAGGLWARSEELYPSLGGVPKLSAPLEWRFPSGMRVELQHLHYEHDKLDYQGKEFAFVGFDELTHFSETQFWYIYSRVRTMSGVATRFRATTNPDPDSWVKKLIEWWLDKDTGLAIPERSGVLRWFVRDEHDALIFADTPEELRASHPHAGAPKSMTFIVASLADNAALMAKDPGYRDRLMMLPKVEREQLLGGNWNVRAEPGTVFDREWFPVVDVLPSSPIITVRAWDKAATLPTAENPDPDWTCGALVSLLASGEIAIHDIIYARDRPGALERLMVATAAQDGIGVIVAAWQDPGQAGVADVDHLADAFLGFQFESVRAGQNKIAYANTWSRRAEERRVLLVRGAWNARFLSSAHAFPKKGVHDDDIDAVSLAVQILGEGSAIGQYLKALERS